MCAVIGKEGQHLNKFYLVLYSYSGLCGTLAGLYLPFEYSGKAGRLVQRQGYSVVLICLRRTFGLTKKLAKSVTYALVR